MPQARRRLWSGITLVRRAVLITAGVIVVLFATQWDRWVGLAVRQVTDDAYVRGDITPLSAQIEGYVRRVPVDDFQRVKQGELLVEIEDDDYRARVAQAEADLQAAKAEARGIEAEAMSRRWKLQRAVEDLDNEIALLHARVAALDKDKATLTLAQIARTPCSRSAPGHVQKDGRHASVSAWYQKPAVNQACPLGTRNRL
jgi:membrane fusion protein (multidrug efflux system)